MKDLILETANEYEIDSPQYGQVKLFMDATTNTLKFKTNYGLVSEVGENHTHIQPYIPPVNDWFAELNSHAAEEVAEVISVAITDPEKQTKIGVAAPLIGEVETQSTFIERVNAALNRRTALVRVTTYQVLSKVICQHNIWQKKTVFEFELRHVGVEDLIKDG